MSESALLRYGGKLIRVQSKLISLTKEDPEPPGEYVVVDGYRYSYVEIGNQRWITENLRLQVTSSRYWMNDPTYAERGMYYRIDRTNLDEIAAALPSGWRVTTPEDWETLFKYIANAERTSSVPYAQRYMKTSDFNGNDKYGLHIAKYGNMNEEGTVPGFTGETNFGTSSLGSNGTYYRAYFRMSNSLAGWKDAREVSEWVPIRIVKNI